MAIFNAAPKHPADWYVPYEGEGPWYKCEPDAVVKPRIAKAGPASFAPTTMMGMMDLAVRQFGHKPALLVERPLPALGPDKKVPPALPREKWTTWSWKKYQSDAKDAAKAFIALGMEPHQSVNVWGFNAPEWVISCLGAMYAGGKCAGIYPTDTPEAAAYKIVHSGGSVIVLDSRAKVDKVAAALSQRQDCKQLKAFVVYAAAVEGDDKADVAGIGSVPVLSWDALLAKGAGSGKDEELEARVKNTDPGQCAALIYTSGTTGEPKAVMISHDCTIFGAATVVSVLEESVGFGAGGGEERLLSFLPLSHIAGMLLDIVAPLVTTATKPTPVITFFARPYDLKEKALKDRLHVAKPTVFLGVPLVWEKIADQIRAIGAKATPTAQKVGAWAKGRGAAHAHNRQLGGGGHIPLFFRLANKFVLSKIKGALGLDECKFGLTGAAPIRVDTLEYFGSLGLGINEAYGMSECTGACTLCTEQAHQWGSCGYELPGVEVKAFLVDPTDMNKKTEVPRAPTLDENGEHYMGELCFRGRNIMMGYLACPEMGPDHVAEINKKTSEAIDKDGWLHSGDKGLITEKGMVKITGRFKELIIGEGGENIAPVPIEDAVKAACDGIGEVIMVGDKRKYNVALLTLKAVGANGESPGTDDLDAGAKRVNPEVTKISEAMDDEVWIHAVTAAITAANKNERCCPNNAFKIQKFCILPLNFSEENNELTPTKKLKRKVVETKYASLIDKMYSTECVYFRYVS